MALSPWPNDGTNGLVVAISRLREYIGAQSDEEITTHGAAAAALVEKYAPGAPQPVKDEAVIRFAAYLIYTPDPVKREKQGEREMEHEQNHAAMFRRSGAAALLSPWKIRRAGAIG